MGHQNETIYKKRLDNLRKVLKDKNVEGILVTKRENYMYLSGFTGSSAHLVITQHHALLVTDFRYGEQAERQAPAFEVVEYKGSFVSALVDVIKDKEIVKLGFEDYHMTYETFSQYKDNLGVKEMLPLGKDIENLRMVKDSHEIEIITKAVDIADKAFTHILGVIKPGLRESDIAAELEYSMKKQGASGPSFETIIASGKRSSMPHGVASDKRVEYGDAITLDYGAIYNGYCSDMTRTVFLGRPDAKLEEIYKVVLEAQVKASEGAHKGKTGKEIDKIARDIIGNAGYGDNFGHGLGHGVGLEIHEDPRLSMLGDKTMENGMVVTVEPGIYIPGLGGVRIEDIIIINDNTPLVLTRSQKEMIVI